VVSRHDTGGAEIVGAAPLGRLPLLEARTTLCDVSVDAVRAAFEALADSDLDPLVALIDPQMEWRGRRRLIRFWRPPPS
jgi:hypothetical protein